MPPDGVAIEAGDARLREHAVQQFFQLLRTGAEEIYILATAMHARFGHRGGVAAVVADHFLLTFVVGEGDGAVLALESPATGAAQHHGRISAAIEQNHDLLVAVEPLFDLRRQLA